MTIWLTGDEHYYHKNIIRYCDRFFEDVNEMNRVLIENHNKYINTQDDVFHLGDFCISTNEQLINKILKQLHGRHHLILGNHDRLKPFTYINCGFTSVHTVMWIDDFIFTHDPSIWEAAKWEEKPIACAHIHRLFKCLPDKNMINVGVDVWNFKPITLSQTRDYLQIEKAKYYAKNS